MRPILLSFKNTGRLSLFTDNKQIVNRLYPLDQLMYVNHKVDKNVLHFHFKNGGHIMQKVDDGKTSECLIEKFKQQIKNDVTIIEID